MSTNYYARFTCDRPCKHCNLEVRHLGQTAGGWKFAFRASDTVTDYASWRAQLDDPCVITDEYGKQITVAELEIIVSRTSDGKPRGLYGSDWHDELGNYFCYTEFS